MDLSPCAGCRRHVDTRAARCPFCATPITRVVKRLVDAGGRLSRAAVFAGAAACYTNAPPAQQINTPPPPPPPDNTQTVETQQQDQHFAQPPDGTAPSTDTGSIDGAVVDAYSNQPIANAAVWLQNVDGKQEQARTDANGHFKFDNLAPGNYVVSTPNAGGNPRQAPPRRAVTVTAHQSTQVTLNVTPYVPDRGPCCKPYGAPPARRRVV